MASLGLLNLGANDGTMERWLAVHSGVQQKPQVFESGGIGNMLPTLELYSLKLLAWQTLANLVIGNPKLLLLANKDLNYRIYSITKIIVILHFDPIQPLAYPHR